MSPASAERWVVISAALVAGIYAYRRIAEPTAPATGVRSFAGEGSPPPLGSWATAWGVTFLGVSIMAAVAPGLGGAFAILIAAVDFLGNAQNLFHDIGLGAAGQLTGGGQGLAQQVVSGGGQGLAQQVVSGGGGSSSSTGTNTFTTSPATGAPHGTYTHPGVSTPGAS
jgi:hypothetical protein